MRIHILNLLHLCKDALFRVARYVYSELYVMMTNRKTAGWTFCSIATMMLLDRASSDSKCSTEPDSGDRKENIRLDDTVRWLVHRQTLTPEATEEDDSDDGATETKSTALRDIHEEGTKEEYNWIAMTHTIARQ